MNSITEQFIWVNGIKMVLEKEEELRFGKMVVNTLDIGKMIKPTGKGVLSMLMVTFTKVNGCQIKLMEGVLMNILMVQDILVTGKKIAKMATE